MVNALGKFETARRAIEMLARIGLREVNWTIGANPKNPQQDIYAVATAGETFLLENAVAALNDLGLFRGLEDHPLPLIWNRESEPYVAIHIDVVNGDRLSALTARLPQPKRPRSPSP